MMNRMSVESRSVGEDGIHPECEEVVRRAVVVRQPGAFEPVPSQFGTDGYVWVWFAVKPQRRFVILPGVDDGAPDAEPVVIAEPLKSPGHLPAVVDLVGEVIAWIRDARAAASA